MGWVQKVTTVSTFPPPGTFNRTAEEVAEIMARPDVSPLGIHSGIKMILYFLNRGGRGIKPEQRDELFRAIGLLKHIKAPDWTINLPKRCEVCGVPLKSFYVTRKKSDKLLVITCEKDFPEQDCSETAFYYQSAQGTFTRM